MNLETEPTPELSLIENIKSQLSKKKSAEILAVYWETLKNDVKALAKQDLDLLPNSYVYLYSLPKMYLQRFSPKSASKIEDLYQFFHVILNCLFNKNPAQLSALMQKDDTLEALLLDHFGTYADQGKTPKFIFDLMLTCLKAKDPAVTSSPFAPQILQVVLQTSVSDDEFLSRKSQKLIGQILELKSNNMAVLVSKTQEFIFPILETWFLKSRELPKTLELVKRTVPHFSQENKLRVFGLLFPIAEGNSSPVAKVKIFEIIEAVFAGSYFTNRFTQLVLDGLVKIEDMFVQLLTDKRLVVSFFKARLQVLLNFYSLDPNSAKFYIPSFISSLFEFYANDTLDDVTMALEGEIHTPVKKGNRTKKEVPTTTPQDEKSLVLEETFSFYKRFSLRLFELLVANTFDYSLFAEMNPGSNQASLTQITDLMNNLDLEVTVSNFSSQTTVFKIFALMSHVLSLNFSGNFFYTLRILTSMISRISELGFKSSIVFNEQLARFYMQVRTLISQPTLNKSSLPLLEHFLSSVICAGDLLQLIPLIFKIQPDQQFDANNLSNDDFVFFIHIISQRGHNYRFAALYQYFIMVVHFTLDLYLAKDSPDKMETENEEIEQLNQENLDKKLAANLLQQIVSMICKFEAFELADINSLGLFSNFLTKTLFEERVNSNSVLCKQFLTLLNGLMTFVINNKLLIPKTVHDEFANSLKSNNVLPKICSLFVKNPKNNDKIQFENFLKLFAKLFPNEATAGIIIKNIARIQRLLVGEDKVQKNKGIAETAIISSLLVGYDELSRQNDLFNSSLQFAQCLFASKAPGSVKMGFRVVSALLTHIHQSQFAPVLLVVEQLMDEFLAGKSNDKKFEQNCLKFVGQLIQSYFVNLSLDEFRVKIQQFCEKYFNFIVFNFKNRNQKTRKSAQLVLSDLFQKYHGVKAIDENDPNAIETIQLVDQIDEKSFLVCCLVSGLASETTLAKASCVEAIAFVLKEFGDQMTVTLIHSIMKVVVLLIQEKQSEIFSSALKFMTRILKKQDQKIIQDNLGLIIEAVFEWDAENAKKANAKLKNFISLLNRKYVELKES